MSSSGGGDGSSAAEEEVEVEERTGIAFENVDRPPYRSQSLSNYQKVADPFKFVPRPQDHGEQKQGGGSDEKQQQQQQRGEQSSQRDASRSLSTDLAQEEAQLSDLVRQTEQVLAGFGETTILYGQLDDFDDDTSDDQRIDLSTVASHGTPLRPGGRDSDDNDDKERKRAAVERRAPPPAKQTLRDPSSLDPMPSSAAPNPVRRAPASPPLGARRAPGSVPPRQLSSRAAPAAEVRQAEQEQQRQRQRKSKQPQRRRVEEMSSTVSSSTNTNDDDDDDDEEEEDDDDGRSSSLARFSPPKLPDPSETSDTNSTVSPGPMLKEEEQSFGWRDLNVLLDRNNFPQVMIDPSASPEQARDHLIHTFVSVLTQYEKRGSLIQDMILRNNATEDVYHRQERSQASANMKVARLEKRLAEAQNRVMDVENEKADARKHHEKVVSQLNKRHAHVQQLLSKAAVDAKNAEERTRKVQEKLDKVVRAQEKRQKKEAALFRKVYGRSMSARRLGDKDKMDELSALASQYRHKDDECQSLRERVRELTEYTRELASQQAASGGSKRHRKQHGRQAVAERDHGHQQEEEEEEHSRSRRHARHEQREHRSSSKKYKERHADDADADDNNDRFQQPRRRRELLEDDYDYDDDGEEEDDNENAPERARAAAERIRQRQVERRVRAIREGFEEREQQYVKQMQGLEAEVVELKRAVRKLSDERENLLMEVESRPSVSEWSRTRKELKELRHTVSQTRHLRDVSQYVDTRELIQRDRDIHRLNLHVLDNLPREVSRDILQDVCRELDVNDASLIMPSLRKLTLVVAAMPGMEKFIRDVCLAVHSLSQRVGGGSGKPPIAVPPSSTADMVDQVIPTLKRWEADLLKVTYVSEFRERIQEELAKRVTRSKGKENRDPTALDYHTELMQIRELVELEAAFHEKHAAYKAAQEAIEKHPDAFGNKVVTHFQKLFGVRTAEGVLPAMSQLFTLTRETHNGMRHLREALGVDDDASFTHCVQVAKALASGDPATVAGARRRRGQGRGDSDDDDGDNDDADESFTSTANPTPASVAALYRDIIRKLKAILGVERAESIVPLAERLVQKTGMYDDVYPRLDNLVNQLYQVLQVSELDNIIPALHARLAPPS